MKKLLAVAVLAAVVVSGSFAKNKKNNGIEIAVGGAYGFASNNSKDGDDKSSFQTNNLGFKADVTFGIQDNIGIQLDTAFLFPVGKAKVEAEKNDVKTSDEVDIDSGFAMNLLVGPTFGIDIADNMDLKIGLGFDVLFDSLTNKVSYPVIGTVTSTSSLWNFGVGATADFNLMFADNMGLKFGLTTGITGGNKVTQKVEQGSHTEEKDADVDNFTFFIIPDVSFVIKF